MGQIRLFPLAMCTAVGLRHFGHLCRVNGSAVRYRDLCHSLPIGNEGHAKFYKLGILSEESLQEYFNSVLSVDKKIKTILENIGLSRNVNQFDRDKYKIWTEVWNMPEDVIEYATTLAVGKEQPMQYLIALLSSFHDKNIKTVEDAKNSSQIVSTTTHTKKFNNERSYTKEEMNALFQSIEEIEI